MPERETAQPNLRISERARTSYLQFTQLCAANGLVNAVFTRQGGFSRGAFRSLNTSYGVGDRPEAVRRNRRKLQEVLDIPPPVFIRQVHGTTIRVVSERNVDEFSRNPPPTADALVTDASGVFLGIQVADCQPIFLWDPVRRVAANIHSGWRGSVKNIAGRTVAVMQARFDSRPADLTAAIGPSLGPCCSEFVNYRQEIPPRFWKYKDAADRFDFWTVTRDQLHTAGLQADRIVCSNLCTKCNPDRFFSYRGEGTTGRFTAVIGMK